MYKRDQSTDDAAWYSMMKHGGTDDAAWYSMMKHGGTDDAAWYSMMKHGALAIINQLLCCRMNTYHTTQYDYVTGY